MFHRQSKVVVKIGTGNETNTGFPQGLKKSYF